VADELLSDTACPVCGLQDAFTEPRGYDICRRCGWEDDPFQRQNPDYAGGANLMSLNAAREAWREGKHVE
jgi:anaerobic ribonucleoside-triphosphate reductase